MPVLEPRTSRIIIPGGSEIYRENPKLFDAAKAYSRTGQSLAAAYEKSAKDTYRGVLRRVGILARSGEKPPDRVVTNVQEAMDAARYSTAQAATQRQVYRTTLKLLSPKSGETLLDWGANTAALAFEAAESKMDFDYIPVDGSEAAITQIRNNLTGRFVGSVHPFVHTDLLDLQPKSVDYAVLGSFTHWLSDEPHIEENIIELIGHMAQVARKGVAVSLYSRQTFDRYMMGFSLLSVAHSLHEILSSQGGIDTSFLTDQAFIISVILLANNESRRWILAHMPDAMASAMSLCLNIDPVGGLIYYVDSNRIVTELQKRGLNASLHSVNKQMQKAPKADGPWDVVHIEHSA